MKRLLMPVIAALLMVAAVGGTTITEEHVVVDLATSEVGVKIHVQDLTSSKFTYLTSYPVENVEARTGAGEMRCTVQELQIGTELKCDPPGRNFTATLNFTGSEFLSAQQRYRVFRYTQSFYRPTDVYSLKVVLPRGSGILEGENVTVPVVDPAASSIGTDGRRIFVKWKSRPELGNTRNYQVVYEEFSQPVSREGLAGIIVLTLMALLLGYLVYVRVMREDIENVYPELSGDEIELLELIRENDGEMLQKDVVNESEYSKAKISGLVSGLVEKDVLVKEKKGRSNMLSIAKNYRA